MLKGKGGIVKAIRFNSRWLYGLTILFMLFTIIESSERIENTDEIEKINYRLERLKIIDQDLYSHKHKLFTGEVKTKEDKDVKK